MRTLLLGTTLTLLAAAAAAGFSSSQAAAAPTRHGAVHKITSCGYIGTMPGIYEVTKNLTDVGNGSCIKITANNATLYLDSHTITGTGLDNCIYVTGPDSNHAEGVNDTVIGGSQKTPSKPALLTGCGYGLNMYFLSGPSASYLNIKSPAAGDAGVYAEYDGGMTLSNINVDLGAANNAYGIELYYGSDNIVKNCTVNNDGSDAAFYDEYAVQDTWMHNTAKDGYSSGGNSGTGFADYYSDRNNWSHNTSTGQFYGFYLYEDSYGPVTATYNSASYPKTAKSYGYYVYYAFLEADYASPFHTLISHNKANGFGYGYYDETDTSYAVAEKWTNNTADNYSQYGFYIYYPTDYIMTGNVADGNTSAKKYNPASGETYGFYLYYPYSYYPFRSFSNNQAYDSYYGYYSDEYMVGGKGNVAKGNKYAAYDVEITG